MATILHVLTPFFVGMLAIAVIVGLLFLLAFMLSPSDDDDDL